MHIGHIQSADFDDLPYGGDERLINRRQIYHIKDDVVEMLNKGSIFDVYIN